MADGCTATGGPGVRPADTAREAGGATTTGAARPAGPTGAAVAD